MPGEVVEIGAQVEGTTSTNHEEGKALGVKSASWYRGEVGVCAIHAHVSPGAEAGGEVDQQEAADAAEDGDDTADAGEHDSQERADEEKPNVVQQFSQH